VLAIVGGILLAGYPAFFFVLSFLDDEQVIHTLHNAVALTSYGLLMGIPLLLVARDPLGTVALFRVVLAGAVAALVAGVLGVTVGSAATTTLVAVALVWLHPARRDVFRLSAPDLPLLAIAMVAAAPSVLYGLDQAGLQAGRPVGDPHKSFEHYAGMATAGFAFVLAAVAAAFGGPGERLARRVVGVAGSLTAVAFLAFRDHVGAVDTVWPAAGLVLAVSYLVVTEIGARRAAT